MDVSSATVSVDNNYYQNPYNSQYCPMQNILQGKKHNHSEAYNLFTKTTNTVQVCAVSSRGKKNEQLAERINVGRIQKKTATIKGYTNDNCNVKLMHGHEGKRPLTTFFLNTFRFEKFLLFPVA